MNQQDSSNKIFQLAAALVNDTSQHVFLTGKAGTGKTTFLKFIKEQTSRNCVVVAPTGVAAINAGGVTMHSFFQLPIGIFVPDSVSTNNYSGFSEITDRHSLFRNTHFNASKRELMEQLELLVIDEVSMMRCDMLDAIDIILRHIRKTPLPFGGVQVLYIGDLFQLPPVVQKEEWNILKQYYDSPYFFSSGVYREARPVYVELQKIYRQTDTEFIDVLNRIRNNEMIPEDFEFLNRRYDADFLADDEDQYITITTHNKKTEAINAERLSRLPGKQYQFTAIVKNDFSDKTFPTDNELCLKEGAQVMFIKNDSSVDRRYFNGKIGVVKKILNHEITVAFPDGTDLEIEKETWKNIRFRYDKEKDHVEEEELGSFTQYPIRLAWAITIHKSQGLTFDKVIIDAGSSFAPGQVYVALSRCTSIHGMVLKSKIPPLAVSADKRIVEFLKEEKRNAPELEALLEKEKYKFWGKQLVRLFDFKGIQGSLHEWQQLIQEKKLPDNLFADRLCKNLIVKANNLSLVADKFKFQLGQVLIKTEESGFTNLLEERMQKAILFFTTELTEQILKPLMEHQESLHFTGRLKQYRVFLHECELHIWGAVQKLLSARYGAVQFGDSTALDHYKPKALAVKGKKKKEPKGYSLKLTAELFNAGKSIREIAEIRNMAAGTIEGHLSQMVSTGDMDVLQLISKERMNEIQNVIEKMESQNLGQIKNQLGDGFTYHEVRVVMSHCNFMKNQIVG